MAIAVVGPGSLRQLLMSYTQSEGIERWTLGLPSFLLYVCTDTVAEPKLLWTLRMGIPLLLKSL